MSSLESIRTAIRATIPRGVYACAARVLNAATVVRKQGWHVYRRLYTAAASGETLRSVRMRGVEHPVWFRPGTEDAGTLVQNLVRCEYGQLRPARLPRVIVDAGGYIGDVSVYFLNRYPGCRVITLEPDAGAWSVARRNLSPYGERAELLRLGLYGKTMRMAMSGTFTSARLAATQDVDHVKSIQCTTVGELIRQRNLNRVDVLKLDIEGAEESVLTEGADWHARVDAIIVEYHGAAIRTRCHRVLESWGFSGSPYRSLYYYRRQTSSVAPVGDGGAQPAGVPMGTAVP